MTVPLVWRPELTDRPPRSLEQEGLELCDWVLFTQKYAPWASQGSLSLDLVKISHAGSGDAVKFESWEIWGKLWKARSLWWPRPKALTELVRFEACVGCGAGRVQGPAWSCLLCVDLAPPRVPMLGVDLTDNSSPVFTQCLCWPFQHRELRLCFHVQVKVYISVILILLNIAGTWLSLAPSLTRGISSGGRFMP